MGWLIIRIEDVYNSTLPTERKAPPIEVLTKRHALREPEVDTCEELLNRNGYELGPIVGLVTSAKDWPLTAHIYTSQDKDGSSRNGTQIRSWPIRRMGGE